MNWIFRANTWEIEVLSSFSVVLSWLGQTCAAVSEAAALVSLHYSSISGSCAKESLLNSRGERTCSCSAYSKLCLISSNFQTISVKFQKSMPFDELQGGPTSQAKVFQSSMKVHYSITYSGFGIQYPNLLYYPVLSVLTSVFQSSFFVLNPTELWNLSQKVQGHPV